MLNKAGSFQEMRRQSTVSKQLDLAALRAEDHKLTRQASAFQIEQVESIHNESVKIVQVRAVQIDALML
jgi:hypothetical protein